MGSNTLTLTWKQTCYEKLTILYTRYIILHKVDTFSSPLHKLIFIKIYSRYTLKLMKVERNRLLDSQVFRIKKCFICKEIFCGQIGLLCTSHLYSMAVSYGCNFFNCLLSEMNPLSTKLLKWSTLTFLNCKLSWALREATVPCLQVDLLSAKFTHIPVAHFMDYI
jgi:hypothetical protein